MAEYVATNENQNVKRGDARRRAIITAARSICLEKGFSKITVSDIADKAGMTRSLFYHYFEDKDSVADAVLDDVISEILAKLDQWNAARETGNVNKALDDIVLVLRSLIADESPFSNKMIQDGNAELYIKFIDRAADRIADYIAQTTVRDFEQMHGLPITNVHETFFTLIIGLISLIRSHPDVSDCTIKQVMAQTLHIENYIV
ncbi:TetR/AcrR family transcriptional regulator [Bifidobacterium scaligerum]|uniref:TetR/AcrR family transcriptional regulator n=1 Tax=Bifidobacterium scaligerum TaxID=2052656 RepID=A0A2M9HNN5_9BIFI|nr:TetR/AcrR family transcriptional regulator [Bifidobacterium scaligerum]PJM78426.1 TetR/AcrR family transcriptional regulator [Bifidobacterium scaligerum]